jgi:photosystem II stability/assembly factor-like uncharacterized protein
MFSVSSRTLTLPAICLALIVSVAGCGSAGNATPSGSPTSVNPTASTPTSPNPSASLSASTTPKPTQPSGAPVPAKFKAASVTFVSVDEAFVLGSAPSSGTSLLRTLDRGQTWVSLATFSAPLGRPGSSSSPTVWGTRFASPAHGFVFGNGLFETTDGGKHWSADSAPSGSILSLATIDGQVLALTAKGSSGAASLLRRPLAGGAWSTVASVHYVDLLDPTDLISTQAGTAGVLDGKTVLVTTDGGLHVTSHPTPSTPQGYSPASVAVTSRNTLALLCVGQGYTGHMQKLVYVSADAGAHWSKAGVPNAEGSGGMLAGGSATNVVLVTSSAASWINRSIDIGQTWTTVKFFGDGGMGWADLGFTNALDAVVVHGPAYSNGGSDGRPGQLLLSSDGGATWYAVSF